MNKTWLFFSLFSVLLLTNLVNAEEDLIQDPIPIAEKVADLKQRVIDLNRDLFVLQEELLFPAETQIAVFVSVDTGVYFKLDAIELRVDGKTVAHYLYTQHQRQALGRGGIQRLWMGNIKSGNHQAIAYFQGLDESDRPIEGAASIDFEKLDEPVMIEFLVKDNEAGMRADFLANQWQE